MNTFGIKTKVCFGDNALSALSELEAKSAVILTDAFMRDSGNADYLASLCEKCDKVSVFAEIIPDPPVELIVRGLEFLLSKNADLVIALGGGSSIDAAKSTVLMYSKKTGIRIPLIAVPTTSGTGSEVTKFAVITDREAGVKYPLASDTMLPDVAILSSELVKSVPARITADTGFDVITHALEAYISTQASDFTDAFAQMALELACQYLRLACEDGNNTLAREKMHNASCLAGMAFNDAGLGVNHGIAHALGAIFHIPHGRANAMLLYHTMKYNASLDSSEAYGDITPTCEKLSKIAKLVGLPCVSVKSGAANLINEIRRLTIALDIPQTLADVGIARSDYMKYREHIIKSALNDACTATNPRKIDESAVAKILSGIEVFTK